MTEKKKVGRPKGKEKDNFQIKIEKEVLKKAKENNPKLHSSVKDFIYNESTKNYE